MKKILVFAGSNSKTSINKQLAFFAGSKLENAEVITLDLNHFEVPIFSEQLEKENGIPENIKTFKIQIEAVDGIILSLAEYNGSYTPAFKNIFDWTSRIRREVWENKPMFLLSTSPGARGGKSVFETAKNSFPHLGGNIVASFSLPSFYDNFKEETINNTALLETFTKELQAFSKVVGE